MLSGRVEKLVGGSLDIRSFRKWFMNLEWEDLMASDSAALRLGWDIRNILYQHEDHPEDVPEHRAIEDIERILHVYENASDEKSGHTHRRSAHPMPGIG